jgi:hypothetical protein
MIGMRWLIVMGLGHTAIRQHLLGWQPRRAWEFLARA